MIISCQNLTYAYLYENILDGISFHINDNDKVAIVGVNGAGKTTLFRILAGELKPSSGNIYINNSITVGYLKQNTTFESDKTLYNELYNSNSKILKYKKILNDYETKLNSTDAPSKELLDGYHEAMETFSNLDGFAYESRVKGIIKGLGFSEQDYDRPINEFSGGQKTRLSLGKILLINPDLLLLDEPTNHLDLKTINWLENYLSSYNATLVLISHDRYFLDKLVNKVINLENGHSHVYKGNYSSFIDKKAFDEEMELREYEAQQEEIERQKKIIRELRDRCTEKFIKRAQSREKALEKIVLKPKPLKLNHNMKLQLNPKRPSGNDVLRVKDLSMGFSDNLLFKNLNLDIYKGERVALIGPNGCGKTTLFKILLRQHKALSGNYILGNGVEVAYYDQEHSNLSSNKTLFNEIQDEFPNLDNTQIRNLLAAFLFTKDDVFKDVTTLSGGEKGRLSLAKLMLTSGNFLLLDEPTNHLDMISKEVLEQALNNYTGTIFFISHDRYFINKVATKIIELDRDKPMQYIGNYDYYINKKSEIISNSTTTETVVTTQNDPSNKLDWLEQKERDKQKRQQLNKLKKIEAKIEELEAKIEFIDSELAKEEIYSSYTKSTNLMNEKNEINNELEALFEEWECLSE